jgi:hypothetical protein
MSKRDASAEDMVVAEAATEEDEAGTAIGEETITKEEDTKNAIDPEHFFSFGLFPSSWHSLVNILLDD